MWLGWGWQTKIYHSLGHTLSPWPFISGTFWDWVGKLLPKLFPNLALLALAPQDGSLQCPTCKTIYGVKTGTQPPGKMEYHLIPHSLPGHPDCKTIRIIYSIPPGIQVSLSLSPWFLLFYMFVGKMLHMKSLLPTLVPHLPSLARWHHIPRLHHHCSDFPMYPSRILCAHATENYIHPSLFFFTNSAI